MLTYSKRLLTSECTKKLQTSECTKKLQKVYRVNSNSRLCMIILLVIRSQASRCKSFQVFETKPAECVLLVASAIWTTALGTARARPRICVTVRLQLYQLAVGIYDVTHGLGHTAL